ncbi:3D-(3,5/4)-trihydroxycyclohexane-1,2-dione acylhydrolase (decyclizing) [Listeria ivanovii]|uniref:Putative IolD protein, to acetolactate synthase n=1 Tax=Listeria ivanovii (strain ATCC BAA-678 / PAM 55) TaxID=881621 RepID=G2ZAN4_LISIP|nr:3D-(3,5/4)-trihydroxycyclohexane-1,2-dione acylhydrolase (decyclizing) [Listeria ivanovii]AHI54918.1 3D-(3,5/4)-trihydroxycyclohexane-1,2-dione hydrolase [Listeria ivanovii WSLC3009]AIS64380.1 3D-(3,5/4)-trihydroxycyclohexane-1,2-dione hydrolase [Listeria ivanovii subsp. ivanovii]MBC1760239.1 3D-(3,5/4)-trihydroxycyclohexane-1,2-dione acylhydrolase (decyclizing) [Listeria ivanovii]MCJ1718380.1 3D-(3,5/4)-trihydroxycyclohexane-1,2-dione acylhydrolase (decyclizing) [Listeria ivanovii]MCJ17235
MTEKTIRLTTAQALVKFLNQQFIEVDGESAPFVDGIFTLFGHGNVVGIGQALEENPGHLKVYQGKNEQGMAHAAIGYAKQNNRQRIFACSTSAGPGSANLITAAGTALANNLPVLFLPADTFATRQPDPVLQQLEHESSLAITTNDGFQAVSRYFDRVQRPEQLMSALIRAFEVMTNPASAGPATICIAQDTEGEAFDYPEEFFQKRVHYLNRQTPTERELTEAAKRIQASKTPVIIVGGGARYSGARTELTTLSEQCNIPLVETHAGKSTVEFGFPNNLGGTGILGTLAANKAIHDADLVIGVGTRYTDFTTSSKTAFDPATKFLNINVSRMQTYKLDAFQVVGDVKATLQKLTPLLVGYKTEFGDTITTYKNEWLTERKRLGNTQFTRDNFSPEIKNQFNQATLNEYADSLKTEFTQTEALITINDTVAANSIVVCSAGSLPGDLQRLWNPAVPNTYHLEYGYSCMGYEINGALGAKMAAADKQEVYAIVGDGSFCMSHSELLTSLQYGEKINIMLFDNSGFGCINNLQMANGSDSFFCEFRDSSNQIMQVDYAKIAEGYGAKVYRANTKTDLIAALKDAKTQTRTTLIEMKVLPKTMSEGYLNWWNVGVSEVSNKESIQQAYKSKQEKLKNARLY